MAGSGAFLALVVVCLQASIVFSAGNYFIMAPKEIRPGRPLDIQISIMETRGGQSVDLVAGVRSQRYSQEIRGYESSVEAEQRLTMLQGEREKITLMMPTDLTYGSYYLYVNGSGGLTFNNETYITFKIKTNSAFVQTDKGIYKPGQTVKFRVLAMLSDLKTQRNPFDVVIKDPQGTMMKQWLQQSGIKGVVSEEFQLSEETVQGEWSIYVESGEIQFTKTFTVDEYVLPKFEVSVKAPSFTTVEKAAVEGLQGTIKAKYTYGQPVVGSVQAVVQIKPQPYQLQRYSWQNYEYVFTKFNISGELEDGKLDFTLTPEQLAKLRVDTVYDNQKPKKKKVPTATLR